MPDRTLANPVVEVNNTIIAIVPNSLSFKDGKGNKTMRSQSSGGNAITIVVTTDAETKKGMVKFTLITTKQNDDLKSEWQDAVDGVAIRLSDGNWSKSFRRMHIMEEPEVTTGAEGSTEITFEGQPAV
jgi:hypothetical protein